jgi:hypothetical protein
MRFDMSDLKNSFLPAVTLALAMSAPAEANWHNKVDPADETVIQAAVHKAVDFLEENETAIVGLGIVGAVAGAAAYASRKEKGQSIDLG